jgi:hypothetical protein
MSMSEKLPSVAASARVGLVAILLRREGSFVSTEKGRLRRARSRMRGQQWGILLGRPEEARIDAGARTRSLREGDASGVANGPAGSGSSLLEPRRVREEVRADARARRPPSASSARFKRSRRGAKTVFRLFEISARPTWMDHPRATWETGHRAGDLRDQRQRIMKVGKNVFMK